MYLYVCARLCVCISVKELTNRIVIGLSQDAHK